MIRMGADSIEMRKMSKTDIFTSRLQLLIIMTKALLRGYPLGKKRKQAVLKNAENVFYQSLEIAGESADWTGYIMNYQPDSQQEENNTFEHVLHQRIQLLAVMATSFAKGRPVGDYKKKAIEENIGFLSETLTFNSKVSNIEFLKVA